MTSFKDKPKPKFIPKDLKPQVIDSKEMEKELMREKTKEEEEEWIKQKQNESFRRANDIRHKDPKDLKWYQLALFYELKIAEEIKALEDEIELEENYKATLKETQ